MQKQRTPRRSHCSRISREQVGDQLIQLYYAFNPYPLRAYARKWDRLAEHTRRHAGK